MTAVEWLVEQLEERGHIIPDHIEETSLKMEKQQIMKFAIKAVTSAVNEDANNPYNLEQLFTKTYGSKGSETEGYICPVTKVQCDDECCVSAEDCHIQAGIGIIFNCEQETYGSKENSSTPMLDRLKAHLDSITPEQFAKEFDEVQEWFQCEVEDCPHCAEDIAQMQDEDTFKVWECCGMEECICKGSDETNGNNVEKVSNVVSPFLEGYEQINQDNPVARGSTALVRFTSSQTEISDESWEGCDGCTEQDKYFWTKGYQAGYNRATPTEISDEEIEIAANNPVNDGYSFIEGAKWYREYNKKNN